MSKLTKDGDSIVLEYQLYDLPTVQHKAGLAGLFVLIKAMPEEDSPEVLELDSLQAKVKFDEQSFINTFSFLYDAEIEETIIKQKWQGKPPKRTDTIVNAEDKPEKRFVYDVVQPSAKFMEAYYPEEASEIWLKLWRDMVWSVIRSSPKSRTFYEELANKKDLSLAKKLWAALMKKSKKPSTPILDNISGSIFIGAQSSNSELVNFEGDIIDNLLLHFWQVTVMVYVPRSVKIIKSKTTGGLEVERADMGYVLAIPEPSDLELFVDEYIELLRQLESNENSYWRPNKSLIDIPAEAGLEFIHRLTTSKVAKERGIGFCISSVEIYHLERRGNNVKVYTADRILPDKNIIEEYQRLQEGKFLNPLYKSYRIKNILKNSPWYGGMELLLSQYDWQFFVRIKGTTPERVPFFGYNVLKKFLDTDKDLEVLKGDEIMKEKNQFTEEQLEVLIYKLVKQYIWVKTNDKSPIKHKSFENNKDEKGKTIYPKEFLEVKEKVCRDTFLAVRGRKSQAFLDYFTGTICSVPQYLPEKDYQLVSKALIDDWEKVKTLTLLAISANS